MSREQQPAYIAKRAEVREAAASGQPDPSKATSSSTKPMVSPSNAKEFKVDQHFASRSDAIMSGD